MKNSKEVAKLQRQCDLCRTAFIPIRGNHLTCSKKCSYTRQNKKKPRFINPKNCARCSKPLMGKKPNAIYCSKTCKSMDHNFKHRSKTRISSTARRNEILVRDGYKCYICQKAISLKQLEIDHLVPVSKNGSNSPANLAASCSPCNKRRGNRIEEAQIKKLAELRNQA